MSQTLKELREEMDEIDKDTRHRMYNIIVNTAVTLGMNHSSGTERPFKYVLAEAMDYLEDCNKRDDSDTLELNNKYTDDDKPCAACGSVERYHVNRECVKCKIFQARMYRQSEEDTVKLIQQAEEEIEDLRKYVDEQTRNTG